jgi:uncharacterized protein
MKPPVATFQARPRNSGHAGTTGHAQAPVEERALWIQARAADGRAQPMLGILSQPATHAQLPRTDSATPSPAPSGTAVLIVVGGPQYRVGSHRQFVRLAGHLARAGHTMLRFDFPGMGDSPGEPVSFEASGPFITAAIDALQQQPGVHRVVLWGLCDGASASLLYVQAKQDPRVAGLALLNPWVRHADSLVRTELKHYYRQRLMQASFWRKLVGGGVGMGALRGFAHKLAQLARQQWFRPAALTAPKQAPFQDLMAEGWRSFTGPVLLLLSGRDLTAQEFVEHARSSPAWSGWEQREGMTAHTIGQADHTCSTVASAERLESLMTTWLQGLR